RHMRFRPCDRRACNQPDGCRHHKQLHRLNLQFERFAYTPAWSRGSSAHYGSRRQRTIPIGVPVSKVKASRGKVAQVQVNERSSESPLPCRKKSPSIVLNSVLMGKPLETAIAELLSENKPDSRCRLLAARPLPVASCPESDHRKTNKRY